MTSISIPEQLRELLVQKKSKNHTIGEHLKRLVSEYYYLKNEYTFLEDLYNKASKKNEEHCQENSELKARIKMLENQLQVKSQIQLEDDNEPIKSIREEVIQ